MKTKTSAALLILATLLIGILLGALGGRAYLMSQRPFPPPARFGPDQFTDRLERILDVEEAQRDTVRAILAAHMDQVMDLNSRHRTEAGLLMDTLLQDLRGVLSDEQVARFEEHIQRRHMLRGRRPFGPKR